MKIILYTVKDIAEILQVHQRTVRRYIKDGKIECLRTNGGIRFTQEQLDQFLKGGE